MTTEAQLVAILTALRGEAYADAAAMYEAQTPDEREETFVVLAAWFEAVATLLTKAQGVEGGTEGLVRHLALSVADGSYFDEEEA